MTLVTTVPSVTVDVGGEPLTDERAALLSSVRIHQCLSLPTLCELRFQDPDPAFADWTTGLVGADIRVAVGGGRSPLFNGAVTVIEHDFDADGGRVVRLRAYDPLHTLRKRHPVRAHVQVTAADLARELLEDLGIDVEAEETGPTWQRVLQTRQSDWDLLVDVSQRAGLHFFVQDGVCRLMTLEGAGPDIPLTLGESLLEARFEANSESTGRTVSTFAWNPLLAEERGGRADVARVGRDVPMTAPASLVGGDDDRALVDYPVQDDAQAAARAQSTLDYLAATEVVLRGVADGDLALRPGARVRVSGAGDAFSGRYVLTEVEHTVDDRSGYVSRLSTAPLAPRDPAGVGLVTLGEVSGIDDPERLGRVKVTLPAFGGLETEWLGVVTAGAGAGKGLLALPDVGDRVLVLCPGGDLAHGVVLGGLYGAGGPPDETVSEAGVHRYTFTTPGRQRIRLDDATGTLAMENASGSTIEMGPDGVRLTATAPLTIEAPGSSVRVRGLSIDFEQAQGAELEEEARVREEEEREADEEGRSRAEEREEREDEPDGPSMRDST
jgi:phage baseplate assembly protein V